MSSPVVRVFDDERTLAIGAAGTVFFAAMVAIARRGRFHLALAGGGTPRPAYAVLAAPPFVEDFPWDRHDAWLGDERFVPGDHPASNARMIRENLYRPAGADPASLHTFDTSIEPAAAARAYAERLEATAPLDSEGAPVLDLVLLGLGADTHTASWFPGSSFPPGEWVAAVDEAHGGHRRLTLTPATVNAARHVLFLVSGAAKRDAVARVFDERKDPAAVPAQRVAPARGRLTWMLDRDAAGQSFAS